MLDLSQLLGKETVVGVDIGSRLMKVALAESTGPDRWRIAAVGIAPTPSDAVKDGVIVDRAAAASALRELLRSVNLGHATGGVAAVSGAGVIVRHAKLPKLPEAILRKSVKYEAAKHISSSTDDSAVEFEIIGPVPGEADKMNVTLVAVPNEMLNSRLETLEMAGLEPVAVDVEAFGLQRALLEVSPTQPGEGATLAILDIGAATTDVNIVTNGHFALTRNIPIAGDHFTNALKIAQRIEWAQAEELKKTVDMGSLMTPEADPDAQLLARAIQPVVDELLREVRRSTNYYHTQVTEGSLNIPGEDKPGEVSKLVVTGGSALLKGIDAYMAARLGTTVEIWNVFENPSFDTLALVSSFISANHSVLALCVSLAIKEGHAAHAARRRNGDLSALPPDPETVELSEAA